MIYFVYSLGFILLYIVSDLFWLYGRIYFGDTVAFILVIVYDLFCL